MPVLSVSKVGLCSSLGAVLRGSHKRDSLGGKRERGRLWVRSLLGVYCYWELQEESAGPLEDLDFLVFHPMSVSGCYDLERRREIGSHCGEIEIARTKGVIESCCPCAAKIFAEGTASDRREQDHNLCSERVGFENGAGSREASDFEVSHILGQTVPRYRHGGVSDFGVVNVDGRRILEKVIGQPTDLADSFLLLDDHRIYMRHDQNASFGWERALQTSCDPNPCRLEERGQEHDTGTKRGAKE